MEIRKLKPEEHKAADMLESLSFVMPLSQMEEEEKKYDADRWGCFDENGQLAATLTNHDLPIYFDGGIAPARGVGGVASDPVSRGKGHVRALMEHVLKADREAGVLFSALYPFSHPFYRKFGYETCYEHKQASFPAKELKRFCADNPPEARMVNPKDGLEALYPIYTAFARQYNLAVARDARTWQRLRSGDPYKTEKYCYVLSRNEQDTAYVMFKFRPEEKPYIRTLCLTDYAFVDNKAFYDLMGYLHHYTAQAKDVEMVIPDNLPLSSLLPEAYDMERSDGTKPMARVLDVEKVLRTMRHPKADGAYTVFVEDSFLPENEGCSRVAYTNNGDVSVSRHEGEPDLRLSVQTFTQLALGFLGLSEAAFKPDVQINGNEAVLQQVFVKKPVFLCDFY